MAQTHLMEFWPYLKGIDPATIGVVPSDTVVHLERTLDFSGVQSKIPEGTTAEIQEFVEKNWQQMVTKNPNITNNLLPVIRTVGEREVQVDHSTYKTSVAIKNGAMQGMSFDEQNAFTGQMAFFNVGLVTLTSDHKLLVERRPSGVTAPGMLLNYPTGYVRKGQKTAAEAINLQAKGELGYEIFFSDGMPVSSDVEVTSLGLQRESDEWTPNYSFLMKLNRLSKEIKPTKETKIVETLPAYPADLIEYMKELYSPTIKGEDARGKLVPNATGMLGLYVKRVGGEAAFREFMGTIADTAAEKGVVMKAKVYTPETNPFR